jgi:hypothetical protein
MEPESLNRLPLHLGFEDLAIPRTLGFRPIHRDVCVPKHLLGVLVLLVAVGNSDAR